MSHLLTVKPQFLCFHCYGSGAVHIPCTLWPCSPNGGSWRKSREAFQWLWVAFFSLLLNVTWCEVGSLLAITAILVALNIF